MKVGLLMSVVSLVMMCSCGKKSSGDSDLGQTKKIFYTILSPETYVTATKQDGDGQQTYETEGTLSQDLQQREGMHCVTEWRWLPKVTPTELPETISYEDIKKIAYPFVDDLDVEGGKFKITTPVGTNTKPLFFTWVIPFDASEL